MISLIKKDVAFSILERESFLEKHANDFPADSVVLLTCNRVEVYHGSGGIPGNILEHLFRVTAGLESSLIGETAIQGQVREAYLHAAKRYQLPKEMHALFQNALRVGKRVRSETRISRGAMSHSLAVIEILKAQKIDLSQAKILIIGASRINEEVIKYLIKKGSRAIFIANRTYTGALALGQKYHCAVTGFDELSTLLPSVDILISATAAPHYILKKEKFHCAKAMLIFDLAFPRDIDPIIGDEPGVTLFNLGDIEQAIRVNRCSREKEACLAEKIIKQELGCFYAEN